MDALLVVVESGLSLKSTRENGRLQEITRQRGESQQCQVGQLCEPESRTETTFEQPTNRAGNAPHGDSLPKPRDLGYIQIRWGKPSRVGLTMAG